MEHGDLHGALADPILDSIKLLNEVVLRCPEAVSFAPGWPVELFFEVADVHRLLNVYTHHLRDHLGHPPEQIRRTLFQYGDAGGQIRELVARTLANDEGIRVAPEAVVVTVGCQEGIFGAEPRPTLKSIDRDHRVIYFGSFSKSCLPGVRTGYVVADQPVGHGGLLATEIAKIKSILTVNTSPIDQAIVGGMLIECGFRLRESASGRIEFYRANMRTLLAELGRNFGAVPGVRWNAPDGGFFVTVELPFPVDLKLLDESGRDYGVIWSPMSYFYPAGGGECSIRLSSSYLSPEKITEGVRRLRAFVGNHIA
ncbi:aminotransferase class I/II-fold pyridoxal phosphate-dependent enzyme [Actinoallomurus oryzae]|uniref:aminotransferase class I/II-fold pyridoxal phosphate-dependent enzyme n=1 Tax=Actinoallomurus oryzae TaxID=502180 RepID=UPI0031F14778